MKVGSEIEFWYEKRNGGFAKSKGEARRLIGQKAVKVDGQVVSYVDFEFRGGVHRLVEVGKTRIAQASDGA